MRRLWILSLAALVAFVAAPGNVSAQSRNIEDIIRGEPENAPPPAPVEPGTAPTFPDLAGCENSLAGLVPGARETVVAQLERRIGLWEGATFETVPPFRSTAQARTALDCFQRRLALMAAFITGATDAGTATAEFQARWGERIPSLLTGEIPAGTDAAAWWADADEAFGLLARAEHDVGEAAVDGARQRESVLAAGRAALAEFDRMITNIEGLPPPPEGEPSPWGRAMAWRALLVGVELDHVQLEDLQQQPDLAYAHLTATAPRSPTTTMAPALAELLARTAALRQTRGNLVPGAPRNWSTEADRTRLAEELYVLHAIEQGLGAWIDAALADAADRKRLQLQLQHDIAVFGGMSISLSRTIREAEWQGFLEDQARDREQAVERWQSFLAAQRRQLIEAALALPPP